MPKQKHPDIAKDPGLITARRMTQRPRWVKPRRQRTTPGRPCTQAHLRRRRDTPVTCRNAQFGEEPKLLQLPVLLFERERPEVFYPVPAVDVPLYYFTQTMLRKKL